MIVVKKISKLYIILAAVVIIFGLIWLFWFYRGNLIGKKSNQADASSSQTELSTTADWQQGTTTNMDLASTLKPAINDKTAGSQELPITTFTTQATEPAGKDNPVTGGVWTAVAPLIQVPFPTYTYDTETWQIDLSQEQDFDYLKFDLKTDFTGNDISLVALSSDGTSWPSNLHTAGVCADGTIYPPDQVFWSCKAPTGLTYTYQNPSHKKFVKLIFSDVITTFDSYPSNPDWQTRPYTVQNFKIFKNGASATHISAPTQIDGGANFLQWQTFTPTQTVPANTAVTYQFRTSPDHATWTGWVSGIGSVTSAVGDTKYRYLQVKTTLSNTDGASTPTVDSYSVGYHTNIKPNKPTAATAVIGQ